MRFCNCALCDLFQCIQPKEYFISYIFVCILREYFCFYPISYLFVTVFHFDLHGIFICNTSHYSKSLFSVRWFLFRFHLFEIAFCWFSSAHSFWFFCFFSVESNNYLSASISIVISISVFHYTYSGLKWISNWVNTFWMCVICVLGVQHNTFFIALG